MRGAARDLMTSLYTCGRRTRRSRRHRVVARQHVTPALGDGAFPDAGLLRCPDRAPAVRADLARDHLAVVGRHEVRAPGALMAALRRVLILDRALGDLLLRVGGPDERARGERGERSRGARMKDR